MEPAQRRLIQRGDEVVGPDLGRGLTTAAAIWVTAATGSASGAGLPVLAVMTTGIYFLVVLACPMATRPARTEAGTA